MIDPLENNLPPVKYIQPASIEKLYTELADVEIPFRKPVISVYANDFKDQTGQRRSNAKYATFATAITQAPNTPLSLIHI